MRSPSAAICVRALLVVLATAAGVVPCARDGVRAQDAEDPATTLRRPRHIYVDHVEADLESGRVSIWLRALTQSLRPADISRPWPFELRQDDARIDPDDVSVERLRDTDQGLAYAIVIDRGAAMEQSFEDVRNAALALLERARPHDFVTVVAFSEEPQVLGSFDDGLATKLAEVRNLDIDRESLRSHLYDGVHKALAEIRARPNLPRRAFAVVFTDGGSGSVHTLDSVVAKAARAPGVPAVPVFSLGYLGITGDRGHDELRELARDTSGDFLKVTSNFVLSAFFEDVWSQMLTSYVLRYPADMDGEAHRIDLEIEGQLVSVEEVPFPEGEGAPWLWIGAIALLLCGASAAWFVYNRPNIVGRLVATDGSGRSFAVTGPATRVGAAADNDVVLNEPAVSGRHAVLHVQGNAVDLEDLRSSNGSFVNDKEVSTIRLSAGDRIRFADVEFLFER